MPMTLEASIRQALDVFDYANTAKIYAMLNWTWTQGTPDEAGLRQLAEQLFEKLRREVQRSGLQGHLVRCGGLSVELCEYEDGWEVSLRFEAREVSVSFTPKKETD